MFWGFEMDGGGFVPDIVTLGKPLANGLALGAVVCRREVAAAFASSGMEYFNTFAANHVSCVASLTTLRVLAEERLAHNAAVVGAELMGLLRLLQASSEGALIGSVRGRGLMVGIELVSDRVSKIAAGAAAAFVVRHMRCESAVLCGTDGPAHNVIKVKPPLPWTLDDALTFVTALRRALLAWSEAC